MTNFKDFLLENSNIQVIIDYLENNSVQKGISKII